MPVTLSPPTFVVVGVCTPARVTIGTCRDFEAYVRAVDTATVADLQRCAGQYLKPTGRNVLVIKRKEKK